MTSSDQERVTILITLLKGESMSIAAFAIMFKDMPNKMRNWNKTAKVKGIWHKKFNALQFEKDYSHERARKYFARFGYRQIFEIAYAEYCLCR